VQSGSTHTGSAAAAAAAAESRNIQNKIKNTPTSLMALTLH
jgi:hypothetical protein